MSDDIFTIKADRVTSYIVFTFANSCMPTLMKAKPSCLISFHKRYIKEQDYFFMVLNKESARYNCRYEMLYENETCIYILLYHAELLMEVMAKYRNNPILIENGYKNYENDFNQSLLYFKKRYLEYKMYHTDFPHEVGIFLGYPILDVEEYIKNKGENYRLCGYWKVYHNVEEAAKTFEDFRKLRERAIASFFSGRELSEVG